MKNYIESTTHDNAMKDAANVGRWKSNMESAQKTYSSLSYQLEQLDAFNPLTTILIESKIVIKSHINNLNKLLNESNYAHYSVLRQLEMTGFDYEEVDGYLCLFGEGEFAPVVKLDIDKFTFDVLSDSSPDASEIEVRFGDDNWQMTREEMLYTFTNNRDAVTLDYLDGVSETENLSEHV